jgi:hypothetical protein
MKRHLVLLLLLMGAGFAIHKLITVFFLPQSSFALMPAIPLFFFVLGFVTVLIVKSKPNTSVILLLGVKTIKILLSLAFILLYMFLQGENSSAFLVSFLAYFILYLLYETWMLATINKNKKTDFI